MPLHRFPPGRRLLAPRALVTDERPCVTVERAPSSVGWPHACSRAACAAGRSAGSRWRLGATTVCRFDCALRWRRMRQAAVKTVVGCESYSHSDIFGRWRASAVVYSQPHVAALDVGPGASARRRTPAAATCERRDTRQGINRVRGRGRRRRRRYRHRRVIQRVIDTMPGCRSDRLR
jgi:hypothetical protein